MNAPETAIPNLTFARESVLDVVPMLRALQAERPVSKVRTPVGDEAWVVTHHREIRELLVDARIGRSHPDPQHAPRVFASPLGGPLGEHDNAAQQAAHQKMRRFLAGAFSPGRMKALQPQIEARVDELLDAVAGAGQPADMHELFSWPLPVLVICDLLGVPAVEREEFRALSEAALDMSDWTKAATAWMNLNTYMAGLVECKRAEPADDVLTHLIGQQAEGDLTDIDIVTMATGLLAGGFETTVARIDLGIVLLVTNPEAAAAIRANPGLTPAAVEEILRLAVPGGGALPRYAQEDIEIGGTMIRKGDAVVMDMNVANRDPAVFANPDAFDLSRASNPHLSFGYGPSACIGSALGRIELRVMIDRLLARFPGLRVAVPVNELKVRDHLLIGGLVTLPVEW